MTTFRFTGSRQIADAVSARYSGPGIEVITPAAPSRPDQSGPVLTGLEFTAADWDEIAGDLDSGALSWTEVFGDLTCPEPQAAAIAMARERAGEARAAEAAR